MSTFLHFLLGTENAFQIVSTNGISAKGEKLNRALYKCMYPTEVPVAKILEDYYSHYAPKNLPTEIRQKKIKKKTIDLLDELLKYGYSDCPEFDWKRFFWLGQILRIDYLPSQRQISNKTKVEGFDFDIYRLIKGVSQMLEMREIEGYSTKYLLLEWYLVKLVQNIYDGIYNALNEANIIDANDAHLVLPHEFGMAMARVRSICLAEEPTSKIMACGDKKGLFKDYCKAYPSKDINLSKLIELLDDLKGRMKINPHECNKKTFSAIIYILYRSQSSIGMKVKAIKTFSKFKKIMCVYYDMPDNSFKENDIKDLALKIKDSYPCFNNITFDD